MKYATRKTWSSSQGPKWTGLGVGNIVKTCENKSKKPPPPELIKRGKFRPKKGFASDLNKKAGNWQKQVAKNEFASLPQLSLAEQIRSHMNSISFKHKKVKQVETEIPETESDCEEDPISEYKDFEFPILERKGGMTLTSLVDDIDDKGFNFESLTDLEKLEMAAQEPLTDETFQDISIARTFDLDTEIQENGPESEFEEFEHFSDQNGNQFILEPCLEIHEEENLDKLISETQSKGEFSISSINDVLANQYEKSTVEEKGENETANKDVQYFLEEECVMLSPYSNEAKLYKLLFPGRRIPVCKEAVESLEYSVEESTDELVVATNFETQKCVQKVVSEENLTEMATIYELPVLTSPYTDDMWLTESDTDTSELEMKREPTPEPEREPTPEPSPKEPTPPPPPKECTPTPPREPSPPPKEPSPLRDPTPPPEPAPKVNKSKRKPPEKKKKTYDRNLVKAVQMNQVDEVQQLLYEGADPDTSCSIGTILHQSAQLGFTYMVQTLLWAGSEYDLRNELGDTALHLAAITGHNDIVMMLAAHGCDVDAGNNYDITPLHMALSYGKLSVIQTLVRMDADCSCADRIGDTPHTLVTQLGYPLKTLDSAAAETGPVTVVPPPVMLVHAVEKADIREVREALLKNASPNTIVPLALHWPGHSTVLHRAAHLGQTHIVEELLKAGSNPSSRDLVGNTPLHTAVQDGQDDVVKVLVENGADVNAVTQSGVTPLHRAASKGHETTMLLLLKFGANANLKDNQNKTPMEWARQKGYMLMARSLNRFMG